MLNINIQQFVLKKLKEQGLSRKKLAEQSGISYPVITELINLHKQVPDPETIIKLANNFSCSIDEIVGRSNNFQKYSINYNLSLSREEINHNLKNFIQEKLREHNIKSSQLGNMLGFSASAISDFVSPAPRKKSIGSAIIIKLADYFDVSIDEMIGRVQIQKD